MDELLQKPKHFILLLIIPALLGLQACDYGYLEGISSMEDYEYNAIYALPLVDSDLTIHDIIATDELGSIEVDEENLVSIIYKGRVFSLPAAQIFQVPNQSQNFSVTINPADKNQTVHDKIFLFNFNDNETINWISFLSGLFQVRLEAAQLVADGYNLSVEFEIIGSEAASGGTLGGNIMGESETQISLEGASIDFGNDANMLLIRYTVTLIENSGASPNNAPYTVDFFQSFSNPRYELIYGYIGEINFPIGSTAVDLSIFRNANLGNIFFENPNFRLLSKNSFGAPINLIFNEFYATNKENDIVLVQNADIANDLSITAPDEPEQTAISTYTLDRSNTNIDVIMDIRPTEIFYNVSGTINPGNSPTENFVRHDSHLSIDLEVELPLFGRIDFFELIDTLDLSFGDIPEELEWIELKLQMENGFPLHAQMEILFLDNNAQVIASLFEEPSLENILEPAPTDPATNIVTQPTNKTTMVYITGEKKEHIRNARNIVVRARLLTYNQQEGESVKILDNYKLGIRMGARIKARKTIELNPTN